MSGKSRRAILAGAVSLTGSTAAQPVLPAPIPGVLAPSSWLPSADIRKWQRLAVLEAELSAQLSNLALADPRYAELDTACDKIWCEMRAVADGILRRPAQSWSEIVDRAIICQHTAQKRSDQAWCDLGCDADLFARAAGEITIAVLELARITDGAIERYGDRRRRLISAR